MYWYVRLLWLVVGLLPFSVMAQGYISRVLHHPVPGGVAVVAIGNIQQPPKVFYQGNPVMVVRDTDKQWIAIAGIDLKTTKGKQYINLDTPESNRQLAFQVVDKKYAIQRITLKNKSHVNPDPVQVQRYQREYQEQITAYSAFRDRLPSNVVLDKPVEGRTSSVFGLRRFFNNEERNPHSGLDFAVPQGTLVKAPADGVVSLVGDYFFNGKTVFLDHGQGMVTMYCHLSVIDVKVGDEIKRGQGIARVGATGRATGPHLHWNVSLNNTRVDPAIFINAFQP